MEKWINIQDKLPKKAGLYECKTIDMDNEKHIEVLSYATLYKSFSLHKIPNSYDGSTYFYLSDDFNGTDVDGNYEGILITHWKQTNDR